LKKNIDPILDDLIEIFAHCFLDAFIEVIGERIGPLGREDGGSRGRSEGSMKVDGGGSEAKFATSRRRFIGGGRGR
jgi:hypothetical protein